MSQEIPTTRSSPGALRSACRLVRALPALATVLAITSAAPPAGATPQAAPRAHAGSHRAPRVTFGIAPSSATAADGRPNFSYSVTPGATLDDHVAVLNFSRVSLRLVVYAADAVETAGGGLGLTLPGSRQVGVGAWIHLPAPYLTVKVPAETGLRPGQVVLPFELRVPLGAPPGDHVGGIVAVLRTVGVANGRAVILNQRIGTRVFLDVAGSVVAHLAIRQYSAIYHGTLNPVGRGSITVSYVLENTGNVDLGTDQTVDVTGLFGSSEHLALAPIALLIPGASVRESVDLRGIWPELFERVTTTAQATAPDAGPNPHVPPAQATAAPWAIPWTLLALIAIVLGSAEAWRRARRTRRRAKPRKHAKSRKPQRELVGV